MNIDVNNVIEKLKEIIGQQAVQIAILQAQVDELAQRLEAKESDYNARKDTNNERELVQ
jgi:uncharacterized coiled-coil protein SlyX